MRDRKKEKEERRAARQKRREERGTLKERYSNLLFAYKFMYRANKKLIFVRIPFLIIQTLQTIIPILFVRAVINELTEGRDIKRVIIYAVLMALFTLAARLLTQLFSLWDSHELETTSYNAFIKLAEATTEMSYASLENPDTQDYVLLARNNRFDVILQNSTDVLKALFNIVGIGSVILTLNPAVLLIVVVFSALNVFIDYLQRDIPRRYEEERVHKSRRAGYLASLMTYAPMGKEVRVNNLEKWLYDSAEEYWEKELFPIDKKHNKTMSNFQIISGVMGIAQSILIYVILSAGVLRSTMTIGDFSMYLSAAGTFSGAIMGVFGNYSVLMKNAVEFLRHYRRCISMVEKQKADEGTAHIDITENAEIEFRNVSFKYPQTDRMILENINVKIKRGESLSIVGVNGAGKTTFVKLLCRFYEPTSGEILINGIPARDIPYETYRKLLSVVFQDYKLFPFTVRENIAMDTVADDDRLYDSIKKSGFEQRMETLPKKLDTYISKDFDPDGIELSGGESQKLAIARAVYRNTPIIIFDEPTSALDPIAEYNIYKSFHEIAENRTSLYISHRLSSTRFTDHIAVFAGNTIAEYGTHNELIQLEDGIYKKMFEMQAQYYR